MYFRLQGVRRISCALPWVCKGSLVSTVSNYSASWAAATSSICWGFGVVGFQVRGYATAPNIEHQNPLKNDILSFITRSFQHPKGDSHCWLNTNAANNNSFKSNGVFLVLVGEYFESSLEASRHAADMFAKAKLLQQRHPSLQVLALQHTKPTCFPDISTNALWKFMKEFVAFPILLCNKNAIEMEIMPCYIVCEDLKNHAVYFGDNVDIKLLESAIYELNLRNPKGASVDVLKGTWVKPFLAVKEPDVCSATRNLLFSFPGCISSDSTGDRLFLSDVNHHRIVVFNGHGKILDAIGSSPGFDDGDFENAKLLRPAASMYHAAEDILYFVDSENHAIRQADLSRRVVETVFPPNGGSNKGMGLWNWIMDRLWKKSSSRSKSQDLISESFSFPWHILKSSDNSFCVLNQSCETLWIIDMESGLIREVVKESPKILEICQQMILDKCMPLSHLPAGWLHQQLAASCPAMDIPYAGLMSSVANHLDDVVVCDADCSEDQERL